MGKKLTAVFVEKAPPGKHYDPGSYGLLLRVRPSGSKNWFQRITIQGRRCTLGLGSYPLVSLKDARAKAMANRLDVLNGGDPLAARRATAIPTFEDAAERVIAFHAPSWKHSGKSAGQWRASLRDYVLPSLGRRRVDTITTADVLAVLVPIWNDKRETARRVRQRIGAVMKWAVAEGYRQDNPAGDAIGAALPKTEQVQAHHRALPHAQVAAAVERVRESGAWVSTRLAFEFLVLTAARSGEVRLARWSEIDFETAVWTIPAQRMKAKREHRVPLSARTVAILEEARDSALDEILIFPSANGRTLSDATISKLLRELGIEAVPHGFRSSFRDFCGDTGQPREVAEACLAHVVKGVEGAYARSDLLERRRAVMEAWSRYVASDNVVALRETA